MEMTIDEAIEYNKNLKMYMEISDEQQPCKFLEENHTALSMAIDTMRKYQKIEQVLSDYINDDSVGMSDYWMGRIKKVVDGNDD